MRLRREVKRNFGDGLRSKKFLTLRNEVLAKIRSSDLVALVHEMSESGIVADFRGRVEEGEGGGDPKIIRFPRGGSPLPKGERELDTETDLCGQFLQDLLAKGLVVDDHRYKNRVSRASSEPRFRDLGQQKARLSSRVELVTPCAQTAESLLSLC